MFRPLLIPFILLAGWLGCTYLFGEPIRTATPSFAAARGIAPLEHWGVMFLIGAVVLTAAMFVRNHHVPQSALIIGGAIYTWWAFLFLFTVLRDERASLNAPALYGFIAAIHFLAANPQLIDRLRQVSRP